jgi:hypothetical protein
VRRDKMEEYEYVAGYISCVLKDLFALRVE